ncbi:hypothetical protein EHS86_15180 [Erwinia amylovora]|uniref:Uncharacterized protein n=3 Tax=Erwinia amylovora TaxID=552 RepID=A0A830ZY23_ERWAM|nr:hypothetical protein AD997_00710 [Erwinia amylovora]EKV55766.1 hypothetical protein EaACW_0145 [Erwinia amylovora ACW56400]CBA19082.1 hypothetical protein predicted by Glimmer/Critica [Erwinia amylovora CFBP1430]CBX78955.1 hypothetical protein predicted by Glimmer/Critica [Erwinia amylovora ATCC BAA-2158]CCO76991.1 hypothetical protein BN432_0145 [Erwinia amylovora Ea356]CCO80770.1 hypothetical protein BN433_0150 [Erwinia amylovora Ea266]CCO84579.1 hypothetical protein BN434_0142 [Erwinia 
MNNSLDIFSRPDEEISGIVKQRRFQKAPEAMKQGQHYPNVAHGTPGHVFKVILQQLRQAVEI